jgi:glycosyltransferase involved in cell wall biosynthesis
MRHFIARYMVNSQATKDSIAFYESIDPSKIDIIYNGLDLSRFSAITNGLRDKTRSNLGIDDGQVLIGMVAHLRKEKNLDLFVEAARQLAPAYPQARYILLGDGRDRPALERQVKRLGLDKIMRLAGSQMDVVPYLAAMDIACLTSDGESFSNAIIEYLAAGLPVVATAVGGNIEAVPDAEFLFPRGDLDKFKALLARLIEDNSLRCGLGRRGKEAIKDKYSVAEMVSGHEAMYDKCLAEN